MFDFSFLVEKYLKPTLTAAISIEQHIMSLLNCNSHQRRARFSVGKSSPEVCENGTFKAFTYSKSEFEKGIIPQSLNARIKCNTASFENGDCKNFKKAKMTLKTDFCSRISVLMATLNPFSEKKDAQSLI